MYCPLKFNANTLDSLGICCWDACQCEEEQCMAWNRVTETCDLVRSAHRRSDREISETEGGKT